MVRNPHLNANDQKPNANNGFSEPSRSANKHLFMFAGGVQVAYKQKQTRDTRIWATPVASDAPSCNW